MPKATRPAMPSPKPGGRPSTGARPSRRRGVSSGVRHAHFRRPASLVVALGAGMQRHRHAVERLGRVDRLGGGVGGGELVEVLEQQLGHLVDGLVRHAVVGDEEVADRRGRPRPPPGRRRCRRGWSRRQEGRADLRDDLRRHRDDVDRHRGREVADRGDAEAGRLQRGVELAVLDQLDQLGEGQVLDLAEVVVAHAGGGEDRAGVELGAGGRRADRQALALEVGERLDAGLLAGDDLDVVRDRSRRCRAACRACRGSRPRCCPRPPALTLSPSEKAISPLPCCSRFRFSTDALVACTWVRAPVDALGVDLRQRDAERVVDARRAAGQHVDELLRLGAPCPGAAARIAAPASMVLIRPNIAFSLFVVPPARGGCGASLDTRTGLPTRKSPRRRA